MVPSSAVTGIHFRRSSTIKQGGPHGIKRLQSCILMNGIGGGNNVKMKIKSYAVEFSIVRASLVIETKNVYGLWSRH